MRESKAGSLKRVEVISEDSGDNIKKKIKSEILNIFKEEYLKKLLHGMEK